MLSSLWDSFLSSYEAVVGTGSILALFAVALFYISYIKKSHNEALGTVAYVFAPVGAVAKALADALSKIRDKYKGASATRRTAATIFAVILVFFIIVMSGERIIAPDFSRSADNPTHIPNGLCEAMDAILGSTTGEVGVVTMPGANNYFTAYSSRFRMIYDEPVNGDITGFSREYSDTYGQLSDIHPDMSIVARGAREGECDYIVLKSDAYWPTVLLEDCGYSILGSFDGWNVYVIDKGVE